MPSARAAKYARWNIGQSSAALNAAGRYTNCALGGRLAFSFFATALNWLQAGQP